MFDFVKEHYPNAFTLFKSLPWPILRADLIRYMVVEAFGGVYADMDVQKLKGYDKWVPSYAAKFEDHRNDHIELILGIEMDSIGKLNWQERYSRELQFCQWTFASRSHHPILLSVIRSSLAKLQSQNMSTITRSQYAHFVMETTGPGIWTDEILNYLKRTANKNFHEFKGMSYFKLIEDILILSMTAFSPGVEHSDIGSCNDPRALVQHFFRGSWKSQKT